MKILILNGPNLNLLGKREPAVYGNESFETYFKSLQKQMEVHDIELEYFQSNHEGALIDKLHDAGFSYHGIVFNPGAYTHTSIAIADAVAAIESPVIEVHISNIEAREEYRKQSFLAAKVKGRIQGFGLNGYRLAVLGLLA